MNSDNALSILYLFDCTNIGATEQRWVTISGWQVVNLIQLSALHNNGLELITLYRETENVSFSASHQ